MDALRSLVLYFVMLGVVVGGIWLFSSQNSQDIYPEDLETNRLWIYMDKTRVPDGMDLATARAHALMVERQWRIRGCDQILLTWSHRMPRRPGGWFSRRLELDREAARPFVAQMMEEYDAHGCEQLLLPLGFQEGLPPARWLDRELATRDAAWPGR